MTSALRAGLEAIQRDPTPFLEFLREHSYPVYHKSNLFFRDLQYGLWRFLRRNTTRVSYVEMERLAAELIAGYERSGLLKRIDRRSFELNMPEYAATVTLAQDRNRQTRHSIDAPASAGDPGGLK